MKRTLVIISTVVAAVLAMSAPAQTGEGSSPALVAVKSVSVIPESGKATVVVSASASIVINDFKLQSPHRIVLDMQGAKLEGGQQAYDRVMRGGITNIRMSQYRTNIVRVVIDMDAYRSYDITRNANEVRVTLNGAAGSFAAWASSGTPATASAKPVDNEEAQEAAEAQPEAETVAEAAPLPQPPLPPPPPTQRMRVAPIAQKVEEPRITVTYQDADIRDVIAAFASFSGRTIVVGRDVSGTVTAEIKNQPWDVALRAILQGQGLAMAEDITSGIITIDSYVNIQAKQSSEPLVTQFIPINYASAAGIAPIIRSLLSKDCSGSVPAGPGGGGSAGAASTNCIVRGAVASDSSTNTLLVTEVPSRMADLLAYVRNLDIRTRQVAIKAKIIFVNRTDIEDIGLSYDLGTRDQFFSDLVQRTDPSTLEPVDTDGDGVPDAFGGGEPFEGDRISLGGNALSAIANASARVANPALKLVFSTTLGRFQLTSFLEALQEIRLADLQAEPSIVTLDNRRAEILVGQEIPIRVLDAGAGAGDAGAAQAPRATVQLKEVGIILIVTPHITNNRQILLNIHAENSNAQIENSDVGFVFNKQRSDNQLLVNDGETAVIGGLTVTQVSQFKTGIPILVDLPLIGKLFGQTRTSEEKRDLLILVTPHIVDEGEAGSIIQLETPRTPRTR